LVAVAVAVLAASVGVASPPSVAAADIAVLIRTSDTSGWPSSDPSGIAYDSVGDHLVVVDGEIEEADMAWLWPGYNGSVASRQGQFDHGFDTTDASPTNKEPVGAGYDPARDELYISKDGSNSQIWVYERGAGGQFDTVVRHFAIGDKDAEGVAFGNGTLYVSDGQHRRIWSFAAGNDGIVGTGDDPAGTSFDVGTLGQRDPEGLEYDTVTGNLWAVSRNDNPELLEVTVGGSVVRRFNLGFLGSDALSGLALAPASDGSGAPHLYITDRGIDNAADPFENDGKIYEIAIVDGGDPPPPPAGNLVVNGGFEAADSAGAPTAWTANERFRQSAENVHSGSFAGRHQATDNGGYQIVQNVAVVAGTTYQVSSWLNVQTTSDAFTFILRVQWRGSSGKIGVEDIVKLKSPTSGWTNVFDTLVAPPNANQARIMMVVKSLNATIYIDDVILGS
jgi:Carbohydrate binding domain